ncbi:DDE_3 domain-containing protein [Caerostris extrusa]|uniref:DDE_3 domain-containing protein n=1 Tax=Caerostris extrusa TaxID=172846 RepID=A0AAV4S3G6_CAEEX|nr:DDE_3 domain-containing protein [Caerostris extrusa]
MDWPAKSPDLNHIEHAWDALVMSQPPPRTILELKIALGEEWEGLPQALLNSLNNSMHTVVHAVSVRGDHTPSRGNTHCTSLTFIVIFYP